MTVIAELVNLGNGCAAAGDKLAMDICRDAITEIEGLQAIVDKLPKTADGVPVVPGMELWHHCQYKKEVRSVTISTDYSYMPSDGRSQLNIQHVGPSACHSTREAAEGESQKAIEQAEREAAEAEGDKP